MKKYDFLIVDTGLFGSVFTHEMTKRGNSCLVLEKRKYKKLAEENKDIIFGGR